MFLRSSAAATARHLLCAGLLVCAGAAAATPFYAEDFSRKPSAAQMTALGRALFFDPALSASGKTACASCHDPRHAYGPPDGRAVRLAGPDGKHAGLRTVPSLRYLQAVPAFTEHFEDEDQGIDQGPAGGRTWDGRAASVHEQARLPLFSPLEMANASADAVVAKVAQAAYASRFRAAFGDDVFADPQRAFNAILLSLEVFQQDPKEFYPYSSKYDAWLRGRVQLSEQERRGLVLFNDPRKGNCASCHPSGIRKGAFPQFTDFGYAALGLPRNRKLPANADPRYYDLGLCGPLRKDLSTRAEYCGMFRVPSLRNVATRRVFFHNGAFHTLEDAIRFYASRDSDPGRWYPRDAQGRVRKFDDLPERYRASVNRDPPFGGKTPALSDAEIADLLAFLKTLTDGYRP